MHANDLINDLTDAFDGVPPPGPGQRDLFDAEAEDTYAIAGPHPPHPARWQDLPTWVLEATAFALAYLDPGGFRYALPAVLCADLRAARCEEEPPAIAQTVQWHLMCLDPDGRAHTVHQLSALNHAQRRAVAAWVALRGRDPSLVAAWARLAEAEAEGPVEAWSECLFPPRPLPDREAVARALWAAFPEDHAWRTDLAETLADPSCPANTTLVNRLRPDLRPREKAAHQAHLAALTWPQRRALAGLAERCLPTPARAKWARLTAAETEGPVEGWLEILYAPPD